MSRTTYIKDLPFSISKGRILDPYAGRGVWWRGTVADVTFCDKFIEKRPGLIYASADNLPFADGVFDQVWADLPHFIRKSKFAPSCRLSHFGAYPTRDAVQEEWRAVAKELSRVTKPAANLVWKIIDGAKTAKQCVCRLDAEVMTPWWIWQDEFKEKSKVPWSSAWTIYLYGVKRCHT